MDNFWNFYPSVMIIGVAEMWVIENQIVYPHFMAVTWYSPPMDMRIRW
jgi:hypothetical protein